MGEIIALLREIRDHMKAHAPAKDVMDMEESAAYLGVSVRFFRELISYYKVPPARLSTNQRGRYVFRKRDLDEFLASRVVRSPQEDMRLSDGRRREHRRNALKVIDA